MRFPIIALIAGIFLSACSQITTLRTQEIRSVETNLQTRVDSLELKLDTMRQEQIAFQRRMQADLASIVGAQENGINRMISMMEEMGYTVEKVAANTEKIKNKKIKVEHVIRSVDTSAAGVTISAIEDEEVDKLIKVAEEDFAKGNFKSAFSNFKEAFKIKPDGLKAEYALFQSGVAAYSAKQYKASGKTFEKLRATFAEGALLCSAQFYQALIADKMKDKALYKESLQKLVADPVCKGKDEFFQAQERLK